MSLSLLFLDLVVAALCDRLGGHLGGRSMNLGLVYAEDGRDLVQCGRQVDSFHRHRRTLRWYLSDLALVREAYELVSILCQAANLLKLTDRLYESLMIVVTSAINPTPMRRSDDETDGGRVSRSLDACVVKLAMIWCCKY